MARIFLVPDMEICWEATKDRWEKEESREIERLDENISATAPS